MTYTAAAAGLEVGGGKSVIIGDPRLHATEDLFKAFGRHVHSLGGRYVTAEDVGTTCAHMDAVRTETPHVVGVSKHLGGAGDPSPMTAEGVANAMRAAAEFRWGSTGLDGRHVAVIGTGKVGYNLVAILHAAGALTTVADTNADAVARCVREFGSDVADPGEIVELECDILAPCALGAVFDEVNVDRLRCDIICGAANNQLANEDVAELIAQRDILYAPDFIVNAGGLINVAVELEGYHAGRAHELVARIYKTTKRTLERARDDAVSTAVAARQLAQARIDSVTATPTTTGATTKGP